MVYCATKKDRNI